MSATKRFGGPEENRTPDLFQAKDMGEGRGIPTRKTCFSRNTPHGSVRGISDSCYSLGRLCLPGKTRVRLVVCGGLLKKWRASRGEQASLKDLGPEVVDRLVR